MGEVRHEIIKALSRRLLFSSVGITLFLALFVLLAPWREIALLVAATNCVLAVVFGCAIALVYLTEKD